MARLCAAGCVGLLAAGLRFHDLGAWSFAGDELATTYEARVRFAGAAAAPGGQPDRLPRLLPASYVVHYLGYSTFGDDEFGARVPAAIFGSLLPLLAVALLWRPLGGWAGVATGLLLALSPEAIFQSQQNRFYMTAGAVAGACVAAAAAAVETRRVGWFVVASGLALVGPLFHPVLAALALGLAAAVWAGMPTGEDQARRRFLLIAGGVVLGVGALVVGYHLPLLRGWNAGADWGYSTSHAVLGGVKRLGVPTALLTAVGLVWMFQTRYPARWFWVVWVAGWAATLVVFPLALAYHPAYSFPFAFAPLVVAGYAIGEVAHCRAVRIGRASAVVWVGAACLFNLPALVSHFADGSRHDHRKAAQYVTLVRQPGDAVAAVSPANLAHYETSLGDAAAIDPERLPDEMMRIGRQQRPTWLVLPTGRLGRDPATQAWLNRYARLERSFRRKRVDYDDYTLDVYKFDPRPR